MTDRPDYSIDISEPLKWICDELGLTYHDVAEITWQPRDMSAKVMLRNAHGSHYVDPDTNQAAHETVRFKIIT